MRHFNKFLFLIGLLLLNVVFPPVSNAQDMEKTVIITKKWGGSTNSRVVAYALSVEESYNSNMTIDGYSFLLSAQNDKYETLQDLFAIASGSAQNIYNFTEWVLRFMDVCSIEDVKVPIEDFGLGLPLTIQYVNWKLMGKKYYINSGNSYHLFKKSEFEKIQKDLLKYCKKQGIEIDTKVEININPALEKK